MNELLIIIFVFALAAGWIFFLFRHYYLIRFTFQKYMSKKYPDKWKALKAESNLTAKWLRTEKWFHPYISQSVYNFIWRSKDNYNNPIVELYKKKSNGQAGTFLYISYS
jgi:hypothetical protein